MKSFHAYFKSILKSNRFFYLTYYYTFNSLIRILRLFIRTDSNLVLFVSYGGKRCDDSPRVLYDYMMGKEHYKDYKCVWALINPDDYKGIPNKVKIDTLEFYICALKAGYWITNSSVSRGLNLKQKGTKYFLFPHGTTGIKKIGHDIVNKKGTYRQKSMDVIDKILVQSLSDVKYLSVAWGRSEDSFCLTGFPRNDRLGKLEDYELDEIKAKLGIPKTNRKIILYAPTFREHSISKGLNSLPVPFDFERMKTKLGKDYVLVITAHYEVAKLDGKVKDDDFVINAFDYPYFDELLQIADILITDYSSCAIDFSIKCKPIFCYGYDYDYYLQNRGFYEDLEKFFCDGVLRTQEQLEDAILNMDFQKECDFTKTNIKDRFIDSYGDAAERSAKVIFGK